MDSVKYSYGELFCGPGGMARGAMEASCEHDGVLHTIEHSWASDYDESSCDTYRENICPEHHESVFHEDVRGLDIAKLPKVDILAFGFPCNDHSNVGESKGLYGEFGDLYKYGVRYLDEHRPKAFVAENVSGINSGDSPALQQILSELVTAGEGYKVTCELYKFEDYGVPQNRHRYVIVGIRKDLEREFHMPAPAHSLAESEPVTSESALTAPPPHLVGFGIGPGSIKEGAPQHEIRLPDPIVERRLSVIPEGKNAWCEEVERDPELRINTRTKLSSIYRRLKRDQPAYTVTGSGGGGTYGYHWEENRALSNREKARLQTFPDDFVFSGGKSSVRKQVGMAVPPYASKQVFTCLLGVLAGASSVELPSSCADPKRAVTWRHGCTPLATFSKDAFKELRETMGSGHRIDILVPEAKEDAAASYAPALSKVLDRGGQVRVVIGKAWKFGMLEEDREGWERVRDMLDGDIEVVSSFVPFGSSLVLVRGDGGETIATYTLPVGSPLDSDVEGLCRIHDMPSLSSHVDRLMAELDELPSIDHSKLPENVGDQLEGHIEELRELPRHELSLDPEWRRTASIDLIAIARKSPVSSFNLSRGKGRKTKGRWQPRPWYEIELTIGNKHHHLPREFTAFTDDGLVMKMGRSGGSSHPHKDLASRGNRPLFGAWFKRRLEASGALERHGKITTSTLYEHGETSLEFYRIRKGEYFMRLAP